MLLFFVVPILACCNMLNVVLSCPKLTAVTDSFDEYVQHLYEQLRNESPPSAEDPAMKDAQTRQRICDDIFSSGVFIGPALKLEDVYGEVQRSAESASSLVDFFNKYELDNPCISRKLEVPRTVNQYKTEFYEVQEYAFVCLARKQSSSNDIAIYYISKEYNLLGTEEPYTAGRFIFGGRTSPPRDHLKVAEEPATVPESIEREYLRIKSRLKAETSEHPDPVCKLITDSRFTNHYHRFCVKVLSSSHFKPMAANVIRVRSSACPEMLISFRTVEVKQQYKERMVLCYATTDSGQLNVFYISRAYESRAVFVYIRRPPDDKIYLEQKATNMNFVNEAESRIE